jgi:hypothetical protein
MGNAWESELGPRKHALCVAGGRAPRYFGARAKGQRTRRTAFENPRGRRWECTWSTADPWSRTDCPLARSHRGNRFAQTRVIAAHMPKPGLPALDIALPYCHSARAGVVRVRVGFAPNGPIFAGRKGGAAGGGLRRHRRGPPPQMVNAEFLKYVPTHQGLPLPQATPPDRAAASFSTLVLPGRGGVVFRPAAGECGHAQSNGPSVGR